LSDYNLWVNDINNRFSPTSLTHASSGSGYTATAIISGVTTNSSWKMSLWHAYQSLRNKLLGVSDEDGSKILAISTTTQSSALSSVTKGQLIYNSTTGECDISMGSSFVSTVTAVTAVAYGDMYENSAFGSDIDSTYKTWITASKRVVDDNGIVTFVNDVTGDYLLIGTDGVGKYSLQANCTQKNSGGKNVTMNVFVNGTHSEFSSETTGDSSKHESMTASGIITLAAGDKISLYIVSDTSSDTILVYDTSLSISRIST